MPRAGLSRAKVVQRAAELADELGYERLTLAVVAADFGVRVPSLYKHVGGLDQLRCEVALVGGAELSSAITDATVGLTGVDAMVAIAQAHRRAAQRHPGRTQAYLRYPLGSRDGDVSGAMVAVLYSAMREAGVAENDLEAATVALRATLRGFVLMEATGTLGPAEEADAMFDQILAILGRALPSPQLGRFGPIRLAMRR